jgi:hypothetical protein
LVGVATATTHRYYLRCVVRRLFLFFPTPPPPDVGVHGACTTPTHLHCTYAAVSRYLRLPCPALYLLPILRLSTRLCVGFSPFLAPRFGGWMLYTFFFATAAAIPLRWFEAGWALHCGWFAGLFYRLFSFVLSAVFSS